MRIYYSCSLWFDSHWIKNSTLYHCLIFENIFIHVLGIKHRDILFDKSIKYNIVCQCESSYIRCIVIIIVYFLSLYIENIKLHLFNILVSFINLLSLPSIQVSNVTSISLSKAKVLVFKSVLII